MEVIQADTFIGVRVRYDDRNVYSLPVSPSVWCLCVPSPPHLSLPLLQPSPFDASPVVWSPSHPSQLTNIFLYFLPHIPY
ncbi:hypothetical protein Pmani_016936 [Petrolisthes manimaculis]|uniref:Uncharacterized protein n=1 Tax=Petrolisthes manimaculis TaxID=1843537 RepID=A0AAE1PNP2_9EUCA|nr:hypothetical protein Pmani_016936 [Petrolisthes manimaculis]